MAKEWKSGIDDNPIGDARLWDDGGGGSGRSYCLRLGWREYHFTRGEILLTLFVGLFVGLIVAAGQAGYLKLPDRRANLGIYEPPKPRLLGSTENTRPEAGDPDVHFVDRRGRAAMRPALAEQSDPTAAAAAETGSAVPDAEPAS